MGGRIKERKGRAGEVDGSYVGRILCMGKEEIRRRRRRWREWINARES